MPTLEEFAAQQPADYYSEAELIELYQQEHGGQGAGQGGRADSRSAARRRQRLRERPSRR
ncbi:hypothetical protein FSC37_22605 [Piscinibacter aquaticus]|uniref:Uncharacterized protein n=1 Tax=Piscinibacter aquaticus TaxID=392597 RepID=A0A5C6TR31_9BURK|nr:hypothetical protein FSC37_22605 [Piscinibacter aquaticus]